MLPVYLENWSQEKLIIFEVCSPITGKQLQEKLSNLIVSSIFYLN